MSKALAITDDQFQDIVLNSDSPVLTYFWMEGWPPCSQVSPIIDDLAGDFDDKARVVKINCTSEVQIASQYGISSVPAILYFKNGEMKDQIVGMVSKEDYADKLTALI